jgi:tRNA threonylcarbamoyl adenosine modification protein (Sua5/YciO/YrdC/YwlC family)
VIVEWDPQRPRKKTTELIRETLLLGGIIAYPTDTYYGIGCDLFNIKAIRKLYAMKRLDSRRALSIICRDLKEISTYAVMSDFAFDTVKKHLPGPYTFVLKAKRIIPKLMMTERKEVGHKDSRPPRAACPRRTHREAHHQHQRKSSGGRSFFRSEAD